MNVIITGSTGMVGKGVLLECLDSKYVQTIVLITRRSLKIAHPKIKEIVVNDFSEVQNLRESFVGIDACFHCMGVSALGLSDQEYELITYDYTRVLVDSLYEVNPKMVFNYVSGAGTDSSESGNIRWARVKGRTENYILRKGFGDAYMFRPGAIIPERGIRSKTFWYNVIYILLKPFYGVLVRSERVTTTTKMGLAMINSVLYPQQNKILENKEINLLALQSVESK